MTEPELEHELCASLMTATAQRLLTYRWYPTSINTADGRLLIVSGQDLDTGTGCAPA